MTGPVSWQVFGFVGQGIFTARFLVQWIASEKKRDSVVPVAFWWLSLAGGISLLAYAIHRRDPVFMVGQGMGLVVYVRNLVLVARRRSMDFRSDRPEAPLGREGRSGRPGSRHLEAAGVEELRDPIGVGKSGPGQGCELPVHIVLHPAD